MQSNGLHADILQGHAAAHLVPASRSALPEIALCNHGHRQASQRPSIFAQKFSHLVIALHRSIRDQEAARKRYTVRNQINDVKPTWTYPCPPAKNASSPSASTTASRVSTSCCNALPCIKFSVRTIYKQSRMPSTHGRVCHESKISLSAPSRLMAVSKRAGCYWHENLISHYNLSVYSDN